MEDLFIVVIVFGSGLAALKLILDFVQAKRSGKAGTGDRSLTTSELSEMIDDAVAGSVQDLEKRIENLEAIVVDQPMLTEHRAESRLSLPDASDESTSGGAADPARMKSQRRH